MAKLKVYYPPLQLGPSIRRRRTKLIEHAPGQIEIVEEPEQAQLQIQQMCLAEEAHEAIKCDRYVLYLHNMPATAGDNALLLEVMERALLVCSYEDLPVSLPGGYPFARLPQGADPNVFCSTEEIREHAVLTTGFLGTYWNKQCGQLEGEPILETHVAAIRAGKRALHVGPNLEGVDLLEEYREDDTFMANCYSRCHYVSGLRWQGGFECPTLEGLLCGCRPIAFDLPNGRYWWGEHAVFVPHDTSKLTDDLQAVLSQEPEPVSYAERDFIARKFCWKKVAGEFWAAVLSAS